MMPSPVRSKSSKASLNSEKFRYGKRFEVSALRQIHIFMRLGLFTKCVKLIITNSTFESLVESFDNS